MEDEAKQTQVTSEKKKDPKRVAAGKKLAAISRLAKERKKAEREKPEESSNSDSTITYIGLAITVVSLWFAYKSHQRETKEPEIRYAPTVVL
jgi:hypothetical protein